MTTCRAQAVRRGLAGLAGVGAMVLSGCGAPSTSNSKSATPKFDLITPGVLTVATYGTDLPTVLLSTSNTLGGIDGTFLNDFAKAEGLKLKVFSTTLASVILAVQQGKADMGIDFFYKTTRAQAVYYTYPVFATGPAIFTLNSYNYQGYQALKSAKVGAVAGGVWASFVQPYYGSSTVLFPSSSLAANALYSGQIDAYIDGSDLQYDPPFSTQGGVTGHPIAAGQLGIPAADLHNNVYNLVNCSNVALADGLDSFEAAQQKNGQRLKILTDAGLTGETLSYASQLPLQKPQEGCTG